MLRFRTRRLLCFAGYGPKYRGARMQPLTRGPEASDTAASAVHPPYTRLCTALRVRLMPAHDRRALPTDRELANLRVSSCDQFYRPSSYSLRIDGATRNASSLVWCHDPITLPRSRPAQLISDRLGHRHRVDGPAGYSSAAVSSAGAGATASATYFAGAAAAASCATDACDAMIR